MNSTHSAPPRRCGAGISGFTLVEVLAAVSVLLIGLAAVVGLLYGSFAQGHVASDRNAAAILIPEAVRQIEREHLITDTADANHGLFIETLQNAPASDKGAYGTGTLVNGQPLKPPASTPANMNQWPREVGKPSVIGGNYYRTRYRLEKHTDWWPHDTDGNEAAEQPGSAYRGVYVLSIAVYRDPEQDMSKAVQVSDPVVTYLRDRRSR